MKTIVVSILFAITTFTPARSASLAAASASRPEPAKPALPVSVSAKRSVDYRVSRSSVPAVVVQFSDAEPARIQEVSEDLDVMTRIVERALSDEHPDDTPPDKLGIKLYLTGSSRSVRALYVEGFGTLFMIKVNFPLQGAAPKEEQPSEKAVDSEWERTRREVLGLGGSPWAEVYTATPVEFDPKRVDALKAVLIRTLKNASNIRHLKAEEFVSLSIFGSAPPIQARATPSPDAPRSSSAPRPRKVAPAGSAYLSNGDRVIVAQQSLTPLAQGTILALRVKKADVDAFAKGEIDEDAFAKKATFNSYRGAGHDVTSINSWVTD